MMTTKNIDQKYCSLCAAIINSKAEICPHCGVRQHAAPGTLNNMINSKSKTTAGLLALFLGGLGAHKFYLGKNALGVMYLLFCWTFLPAIFGFI